MKITEYALKFKTTVYVLILMIVIVGANSYKSLPLEFAPDIQIPIIIVHTLYPGVAPEDIEKLVTNVIERKLKDLKDVKKMTSTSSESVSVVQIEFETDIDMDDAYQKIRDKVDTAKPDLPEDAKDPMLIEINSSDFPMMLVNLSADYGLAKLKSVAEGIKDQIEQISGVLSADVIGGRDREIQVYLDPRRLEYHEIGVGQVIGRIQQEHLTTPAGSVELGQSKFSVRIPGEYKNVKLMEDIVLKAPGGNPIKIRDVGKVIDGYKDRETISRANKTECITLRIKKRSGENIVRIANEIRQLVDDIQPKLPAGTEVIIRKDMSEDVDSMLSDLENNIISGLILVVLVLLWAMGVRNSLFVAVAIPLSMLITVIVLRIMGITLNFVVLFSLILAVGMLVDNSIVVIENIFRHASEGKSTNKAALVATKEVAWPIIASTATTVACFSPLLFWPGIMGEFMGYMPLTVIIALTASLFVALVINPVTASTFLKPTGKKIFDDSGNVSGPVMGRYQKMLKWSLDNPNKLMMISTAGLGLTLVMYGMFGAGVEFFPITTPKMAQISVRAPQGTNLETTNKYVSRVENIATSKDNTDELIANIGTGGDGGMGISTGGSNTHLAILDLDFKDRHVRKRSTWDTIEEIRDELARFAGADYKVEVEKHGPPTGNPVSVEISGDDYKILTEQARIVKELIAEVPGVVDIQDDFEGGKPEIKIQVDREKAMRRKVNTATISQAVRTAVNGTKASVLREGDEEYDITVRYNKDYRSSINDLLNIRVTGNDDVQIPLRDVAKVSTTGGLGSIKHIDQKRTILVSGDVQGRSSAEVMIDVKALLDKKMNLPSDYQIYYSGESEEQEKASAFLGEAFSIGIMIMFMILITQFNSVFRPAIILGSVVMSLIGVFLGLLITQNKFGIMMTGMGVISLAGVVVNNAIVLIDYTNQCREKDGLSLKDALMKAGVVRFRPVILTAVTTILGMMPMAVGVSIDFASLTIETGSPSVEWWAPMAQAVIFGLAFATVLTLIVVPAMYMSQHNMTTTAAKIVRRIFSRSTNEDAKQIG